MWYRWKLSMPMMMVVGLDFFQRDGDDGQKQVQYHGRLIPWTAHLFSSITASNITKWRKRKRVHIWGSLHRVILCVLSDFKSSCRDWLSKQLDWLSCSSSPWVKWLPSLRQFVQKLKIWHTSSDGTLCTFWGIKSGCQCWLHKLHGNLSNDRRHSKSGTNLLLSCWSRWVAAFSSCANAFD